MSKLIIKGTDYTVYMQEDVWNKIHYLMYNVDTLVKGREIGAWLTGTVKKDKSQEIYITNIHIPEQETSSGEVDITPQQTIKLALSLPEDEIIIGHWHIHPFAAGKTTWSGTDEQKITELMEPNTRKLFVFLLSSKSELFARVEEKFTSEYGDILVSTDELEITKLRDTNDEEFADFKKVIEENVKEKKYVSTFTQSTKNKNKVFVSNGKKTIDVEVTVGNNEDDLREIIYYCVEKEKIDIKNMKFDNECIKIRLTKAPTKEQMRRVCSELKENISGLMEYMCDEDEKLIQNWDEFDTWGAQTPSRRHYS